jgi:hypothetical protein
MAKGQVQRSDMGGDLQMEELLQADHRKIHRNAVSDDGLPEGEDEYRTVMGMAALHAPVNTIYNGGQKYNDGYEKDCPEIQPVYQESLADAEKTKTCYQARDDTGSHLINRRDTFHPLSLRIDAAGRNFHKDRRLKNISK